MGTVARIGSVPYPWLNPGVFVGALTPCIAISVRVFTGDLGANPIATALNQFGLAALVFLIASVACTPLKLAAGWTWPIRIRRMLGLYAFFYAALHFLTYLALDQFFDLQAIVADVTKRKFIAVGFVAFAILIPLALTSTRGMVQRLGFARWQLLHRLVYVAVALGLVHFFLRVKADISQPVMYATVVGVLFLLRALGRRGTGRRWSLSRPPAMETAVPSGLDRE